MKFVHYLKDITGIELYPLISMTLFIAFFTAMAWYVFKTPKKAMQDQAKLPLDELCR
jgi:cbb3-type cytochrome oxidase subunit 3